MLRNLCKTNFTWTGRRLEKLHKTTPKDFTINQTIQQQYKDMKKEDLKLANVKLSNALKNIKQKQIHFIKPDPKLMSKYLKQEYKQQIDHGIEDELYKLRTLEIEDKTLKWQENRIMAEEAAKFRKIVFKKNETLRLLKKEENRPQNYLPIEQLNNESEYANLHQQQQIYQTKLVQLQNQRISNLIENKPEDAYSYLVKSQLIQQFPQTKELINQQLIKLNSTKNEIIRYDNEYVDELIAEIEKSVDQNQAIIDWNSVKEFYKRVLENQNNTLQQFHDHQQSVNAIQDYSNYLFDKFYNNSLDHRIKGKLTFNDLTEEECIRYIKYDINQPEITLRLIDSIDRNKLTPPIVSSIIQKLAIYPFKNKLNYIGLISDNRFRILIQQMSIMQFDDTNLSQSLYALGIINPQTISTFYPRLSFHLYDNLSSQLLERIEYLTNSQLAMAIRNLQMLPIYKNQELQNYLIEEIKKRDNLTLFEAESYMRFMGRNDDPYSIELLKKAFNTEQIELEIDDTTIMIIGQSLQKQIDKQEIKNILERNTHLMIQPISECQFQHLSPFTILLSQCGFNKQSELVVQCKKRMMHVLSQKKDMQDEKDIANLIAGFIQTDSQNLYGINSIYEIVLLQTIYHKLPFKLKSNFHIPYQKLLSIIQNSKDSFQDQSLIIILQSLIVIQQINSQIFKEFINHIKDVQYLFSAYLSLQISDQIFDQLVYRFESTNKSQITSYGAVSYLWALFYLNKLQLKDLSIVSKFNLLESNLDNTSKCLLILILSQYKQLHSLIEQIDVQPQLIEQKYLIALANQSINKDNQSDNFSRLLQEQRLQNDKRQKEIGIERYTPEDIRKQVHSLLQKLNYQEIETNKADKLIFWDIYIKDIDQGFQFVSINDLIKKEDKYIRNGLQNLLCKLFKVKFIIYEEWVRHPDQEGYLKQFL